MGDMTATDNYRVLLSGGEGEIVEKKSRFISTIRKCETEEEAVAFTEEQNEKDVKAKALSGIEAGGETQLRLMYTRHMKELKLTGNYLKNKKKKILYVIVSSYNQVLIYL